MVGQINAGTNSKTLLNLSEIPKPDDVADALWQFVMLIREILKICLR